MYGIELKSLVRHFFVEFENAAPQKNCSFSAPISRHCRPSCAMVVVATVTKPHLCFFVHYMYWVEVLCVGPSDPFSVSAPLDFSQGTDLVIPLSVV